MFDKIFKVSLLGLIAWGLILITLWINTLDNGRYQFHDGLAFDTKLGIGYTRNLTVDFVKK